VRKSNSVTKTKASSQIDVAEAWAEFHLTGSEESRNQLLEYYLPLVRYTAERIYAKLPDKVELDDLISSGTFGLLDAISAFDPERGVKFETYCTPRVRGAILDELRSMDWVPRLVRARAHQLTNARRTLEAHLGRMPTEKEMAAELKINMKEFQRLRRDASAVGLISLSNKYSDSENEKDIREIDIIQDQKSEAPVVEAQKRDLKSLLTKGLSRAEQLIIVLYYYEQMTMKEIGATLDLSESRVSQMHSSIIARLKAQLNRRKKEFSIH
jgi:RNA polymerase sigma factor for flagellar operon FliA